VAGLPKLVFRRAYRRRPPSSQAAGQRQRCALSTSTFGRYGVSALEVVAEAVGDRSSTAKETTRFAPARHPCVPVKGAVTLCPASSPLCSTPAHPARTIGRQGETFLRQRPRVYTWLRITFERFQTSPSSDGFVDFPFLLRREANAGGAVRTATLVGARKVDADAQGSTPAGDGQSRRQELAVEGWRCLSSSINL